MATFSWQQGGDPDSNKPTGFVRSPAILQGGASGNEPYVFPWICTARDNQSKAGTNGGPEDEAARGTKSPYMVGIKEILSMQTSTATPWQWRRICFTLKGSRLWSTAPENSYWMPITSNGYGRLVNSLRSGGGGKSQLYDFLFKGTGQSDWYDPLVAPPDRSTVTVKYDKTVTISSSNNIGRFHTRRLWHPMKQNLVYADDQYGGDTIESNVSVESKAGMGDYYIIDFFRCLSGSTSADKISIDYEATLYWHER